MKRRILLAEDERMIRVAIRAALESLAAGWEICGEAANGREMVEMARRHLPDLILVDIRMPEIDGLAAIEACTAISAGIRYVVLSGLNDFDHARGALRLGVLEYLLKPIRPAELSAALDRVAQVLDEQALSAGQTLALDWQGATGEDTGQRHQALYVFVDEAPTQPGTTERRSQIAHQWREALPGHCRVGAQATLVESAGDGLVLLFRCPPDHPDASGLFDDLVRESLAGLQGWRNSQCLVSAVSLGPCFHLAELQAHVARLDSERFLRFAIGSDGLCSFQTLLDHHPDPETITFLQALDCLALALKRADSRQFQAGLRVIQTGVPALARADAQLRAHVRRFGQAVLGLGGGPEDGHWASELASRIPAEPAGPAGSENQLVASLLELVARNYMLDLGLKQIAREMDLSPNYLSTVFRQHTGQTFISHLTAVRIEQARILLRDHRIPLKEVAGLVGYANRSYFDKVFTAATGQTPGEFRAACRDGD